MKEKQRSLPALLAELRRHDAARAALLADRRSPRPPARRPGGGRHGARRRRQPGGDRAVGPPERAGGAEDAEAAAEDDLLVAERLSEIEREAEGEVTEEDLEDLADADLGPSARAAQETFREPADDDQVPCGSHRRRARAISRPR